MQATIRLAGGARLITVEGETQKDLFEGMAMAYEVFNETSCGLCGSTNIRPVHRVADKYHFYEYHCQEPGCFARLSLGQLSDNTGSLFPVRKLMENGKPSFKLGEYGPHKGWTKYKGEGKGEESQDPEPPRNVPQSNPQDGWPGESSLPPAPAFTTLRNMLGDLKVSENEPRFRDAVLWFCTRFTPGGIITYAQCHKENAVAQRAVDCLIAAQKEHGSNLIARVQEKMVRK